MAMKPNAKITVKEAASLLCENCKESPPTTRQVTEEGKDLGFIYGHEKGGGYFLKCKAIDLWKLSETLK